MVELSTNIIINKNLEDVFELMYNKEDNFDNINDEMYKIIEYTTSKWKIKNGKRKKMSQLYIYVNNLPQYLKNYTIEDDNYIRIRRKYKIINDGDKYKELKCKDDIINLKSSYLSLIKSMKLINIKERIKLTSIEENKTKLDFEIKINIGIPNKDEFENYIKIIFQNILDNLVEKLSCVDE
jgi:hypothetical protein